ncbi:MAG TPA: hypothetical protein VFZ00_14720, partial [Solirubrobacter sp.]|nr:hypothetical protein [Solirubrobacter sp.]
MRAWIVNVARRHVVARTGVIDTEGAANGSTVHSPLATAYSPGLSSDDARTVTAYGPARLSGVFGTRTVIPTVTRSCGFSCGGS